MEDVNKNIQVDNTDKKLHISDVIYRIDNFFSKLLEMTRDFIVMLFSFL